MVLDEGYDKIKHLKIDEQHSEMLNVNKDLWDKLLVKSERINSLGCVTIAFFIFTFAILLINQSSGFLLLITPFVAIIYKVIESKQKNNLRYHGFYEYEICHDRVVRYGSAKYQIFHFDELAKVEEKRFGLVLWKEKPFANFSGLHLMKHTDERLIVIPKALLSYDQVKSHIVKSLSENISDN